MGFFSWLFGSEPDPRIEPVRPPAWNRSENGNATMLWGGLRITVFKQDRGWKYLMAPDDDSEPPFYSEKFKTEDEAKRAALDDAGR